MTVYITNGKGFGTVGYVTSQRVQRSRVVEGALEKTGLEGTAVEDALETAGLQARRVSRVEYRNTFSRDPGRVAREMRITANQSRASVVRRSFAVSYHPSEDLEDKEVLSDLDLFQEKMDLEEHQAVIAVHRDRAHVHAHLVVNCVHPETHELWDSTYERFRGQTALREIERERGRLSLEEAENLRARGAAESDEENVPDWRLRKAKADQDVPIAGEKLRLAYRLLRRVKRGETQTWPELQRSLDARGLRVEKKGRGGVLADENGNEVPLSRVDREFSFPKLEEKLNGGFRGLEETQRRAATDPREADPREAGPREADPRGDKPHGDDSRGDDSHRAGPHEKTEHPKEEHLREGDLREEHLKEALPELPYSLRQRPLTRRFSALENALPEDALREDALREDAPLEDALLEGTLEDLGPQDSFGRGSEAGSRGRNASSRNTLSENASAEDPSPNENASLNDNSFPNDNSSLGERAKRVPWHKVRSCAQKVIETRDLSYKDAYASLPSAEHRKARAAALRAIRDRVGRGEQAEERLSSAPGIRAIPSEEREVILDAARALQETKQDTRQDTDEAARWAAGAWLRRKQEEVLSAARELARRRSSVDPKENAVRARWDGRLRARVAGLSASEAEAVEAVLEAKVAIAPTEEVRKSAETQRRAVRIRRSSRSRQDKSKQDKSQLDLSEKQEEIAAYVAEIENWRSVRRDRPKSAEWRIRRHLKDVGEQEIEDLKGVLSERQRQVLEAQVQLIGVDPEVREEFGPGDAPSEWQREIYRQAKRVAECGRRESGPTGLSDHPDSYEREERVKLARMITESEPHPREKSEPRLRREVEERLQRLSQVEGPASDVVEQAWKAGHERMCSAAWVVGTDLSVHQGRALETADPGRFLNPNENRVPTEIRRSELRATLTRMSTAEAEALEGVTWAWKEVQTDPDRKEEIRQAREMILDEYSRVASRPEVLSGRQEKALAKVYSLEQKALSQAEEDWLAGRSGAYESVSKPVQDEATRLLEQLARMRTDDMHELKAHLEEEPAKRQLLERQIDEARKARKREEAEAKALMVAETASEKVQSLLQQDQRTEAARALRKAQATLKDLRGAAPEMPERLSEHRESKSKGENKSGLKAEGALKLNLRDHLRELLREAQYRELQRGLVETSVEDGHVERGDLEALKGPGGGEIGSEGPGGPQRKVVDELEKAARFNHIPESTSECKVSLRRAIQKMQGMDEEARSRVERALSAEAQGVFEEAERQARQSRQEQSRQEQSKQGQSQQTGQQSRRRGGRRGR
ncbi:hypothetical protein GGP77_002545 [Salinibacter ruber]|uniref:relaxase/mobilization nuclease domain-containing protein n=1 Tax=Salinibacter ruber TaxID=146919 RepID=UPI00216A571B|nr:relaxase/mobilization nuclease domain-containing protein [Salinibacter ruber]MCS3668300.1 hypothetical protein [Salinibacter ruber]